MKIKTGLFVIAAALLAACSAKEIKVTVANGEDFSREAEMVEIPVERLASVTLRDGRVYVVKNARGEVVPSQVTYDGKLIFQSGVGASGTAEFTVSAGAPHEFEPKTYGRLVPERKDDFVWENDRVIFRIYGPALLPVDGPSNGIDAWYKRTDKLVADRWYAADLAKTASYHNDNGEGLDDYKVGRSLGAGAMAPYVEGKLILNGNFVSSEVLENGPLRTTFRVVYDDIEIAGERYTESRLISIDAGSQFTKVTQKYGVTEPVAVAAGLAKRSTEDPVVTGANWFVYEEPATKKSSGVCLAIVVPQGVETITEDRYVVPKGQKGAGTYLHTLAVTEYRPGRPVTYYTGYGWNLNGFPGAEDFRVYVENFSATLEAPLSVNIE